MEKLLSNIKTNKAAGPHKIPNTFLKETASELAPVLSSIFNQSMTTGVLPDDWLTANVSPVFKKGDRNLAVNYRPVSLTCVCGKLLEHIVVKHILKHLEQYNILTKFQHGFRSGHSCETQLILTTHDLLRAHDAGTRTDIAVLDFSKAFDTVPHRRLMVKLDHYGIRGNLHLWIKNFLLNRTQQVVCEGHSSKSIEVASGVPQGTVLGPLLFLCFINDMPDCIKSSCRLFADDCLVYRIVKCIEDSIQLQKDLTALYEWSVKWGMRFNAQKCYIMITSGKYKPTYFYQMNGEVLKQVQSTPYLGIVLSENLTFERHIAKTVTKASKMLGFVQRNLCKCPERLKELSYIALVRSGLEYGACVWDPSKQKDVDSLERVQRRAARFVKGEYRRGPEVSVSQIIAKLGWESLISRRSNARLTMFYKATKGEVAIPLNQFTTKPDTRTRCADYNYQHIRAKKSNFENSFIVKTIPEWNGLPTEVKSADTVVAFKSRLANFKGQ